MTLDDRCFADICVDCYFPFHVQVGQSLSLRVSAVSSISMPGVVSNCCCAVLVQYRGIKPDFVMFTIYMLYSCGESIAPCGTLASGLL